MYSSNVDYYRANSVADAVKMLQKNKGAKLLAGGHSLIPSMKLRVANPALLVDIGRIKSLSGGVLCLMACIQDPCRAS